MKTAYGSSDSIKFGERLLRVVAIVIILCVLWAAKDGLAQKPYPDPPLTLVDDSVPKTVKVASENGWVACPGECLKLATPGWHHQNVAGYAPSDVWMTYTFTDAQGKSWSAYSQRHIGHIIRSYPDKAAVDTGICPICKGTGWVRKDNTHASK